MEEQKQKVKKQTLDEEKGGEGEDVAKNAEELDDDDDELKKVEGVFAIGIGPDGGPLKRNNSDVMNNFFI